MDARLGKMMQIYTITTKHSTIENTVHSKYGGGDFMYLTPQLLLLPDFRSGSAYYAAQEAASDVTLLDIEPCLPRSVALSGVREQCRDIVFALSVEFYGQVFGK